MPASQASSEQPGSGAAPAATRPHAPGYGIPETVKGTLPWSHVRERMERSRNYWVVTVRPDGQPHAVPVWGAWVDDALYFGGGPETRWVRNLQANPRVAVHLEDGNDVVILEGQATPLTDPKHPLVPRLDSAFKAKYEMSFEPPCWVLKPRVVFAWSAFPNDATRWVFGDR